jgi:uncharacterized protein (DUF58 family)
VIPSRFALTLIGAASLLFVFGVVHPVLAWVGLAGDALVVALVAADGWLARRTRVGVSRALPAPLHQGEPATLRVTLENPTWRRLHLALREVLCPELTEQPLDRGVTLPPGRRVEESLEIVPRRRGAALPAPLALRVRGPLGLAWSQREEAAGQRARVLPRAHLEGAAELKLREAMRRRPGSTPFETRGISRELYGLREYLPGDEYRMIHWKAAARLGRPVTRETTWEQHQQVIVLVDCGRPMATLAGTLSKLDHTLAAVLALLRVVAAQQDTATLVLFSKEILRVVRVDRRLRSFSTVFEQVHDVHADLDEPDYAAIAAWCTRKVPRRSLAMLCTSMADLRSAEVLGRAVSGLAARHRTVLVNLEDPALVERARSVPEDVDGAFTKGVALSLAAANRELGLRMKARGVDVLSLPASRLGIGVIQGYLDIKARQRF